MESIEHSNDKIQDSYVTHKHLDAVISPMQKVLEEVQRDIKQLLLLVKKGNGSNRS